MSNTALKIDLGALTRNWQKLQAMSQGETAVVAKANAYGLGATRVCKTLAEAGAHTFFVATAEEGTDLRAVLGPDHRIFILSGHMKGTTRLIRDMGLIPIINSTEQLVRHLENLPDAEFGIQLDSGMNRLGMEPSEWVAIRDVVTGQNLVLLMSHLACADEPDHPMNAQQLSAFTEMSQDMDVPRSLSNTGGILLGGKYHFDLTRPGIGIYGGRPFEATEPVVTLDIPVIQCRDVQVGETVGYGNSFTAERPTRIATIAAGYADGILRSLSNTGAVYADDTRCPLAGRVSMDLLGVDITDMSEDPNTLQVLGLHQTVDDLADSAGTIGYEILTSLGARYNRQYITT